MLVRIHIRHDHRDIPIAKAAVLDERSYLCGDPQDFGPHITACGDLYRAVGGRRFAGFVRGEVRFQSGEPVPGATVHLGVPDWDDDARTVTDGRGRFLFPAVRAGVGKFHVSGPGFYFPEGQRSWRIQMAPDSMRVVVPESGEVRKVLHVSRGAVVEGEVRRTDGAPCPGVKVAARPYGGPIAVTDSLGQFRLSGVPPGEAVSVQEVGSPGVLGQSEPFRVRESEVMTGIVVVHRDEAATGIAGRIHVARASLPEDVRLFITGGRSSHWDHASPVPLAPDGSFRIEGRRPGDHTLIAVADGFGDAAVLVEDLAIEEFREGVTVRLFPAESISGRVVGRGGEFVAGAGIHVIPLDEDRPRLDDGPVGPLSTWTGETGRFTIEGLAPGRYRVSVNRPGMTGTVVVARTGDGDVLLETRPGRVIGGILERAERLRRFPESGAPIETASASELRMLLYGHYRIVYRIASARVEIIGVFHGALDLERRLSSDSTPGNSTIHE